ncbi:MAG: ABC transporter permease [Candidatus Omnitrophica bacterium]|nr:ABC transporter permease [Candidatus Omnitrophota bacterium]
MSLSQLKAKYVDSILGIFLALIGPFLIMSAILLVFGIIFKIGIKDFPLFLLSGIFPWMFFSAALYEATFSIINQKNILHQFNLPIEALPLSSTLSHFFNFLIGWIIAYLIFLFFNPKIILQLPSLIAVLLLNFMFTSGLGMILSVINVFFRDIGQLLGILLTLWFWMTPVFYSIDMVPTQFRWICYLNPMTPYIHFYREVILKGQPPSIFIWLSVSAWALLSVVLGILTFGALESRLLKRI